jgi:DHA1 family multidrug resistance protein-like MFS transporter
VTPAAPEIDWRRNQVAVTTAAFIGFTGFTLVMPFLPLYFEQLGVTSPSAVAVWSGVSLGVTPAVTAVMAPLWARVAERYGKKLMVARSLASFVVIMSLMAFVQAPWQVFALRGIQGFFAGYGPIAMTMAAESAPTDRVAVAIGWVQTAQRVGPALGPVIGGTLAGTLGLRGAFLVAAGFYLAAFALVVVGYREPGRRRARHEPVDGVLPSWADLRRLPHFTLFLGTVFGLQLVDRSFGPLLPLYLREIGVPLAQVPFQSGVVFTTMAAAAASGNMVTGRLLARWSAAWVVPAGAAVAAVGAGVFAAGGPVAVRLVTAAVFGCGIGVATTAVYTATTSVVPHQARGVAFGYLTTAYLAGLAISPILAGLLGAISMRGVFFADALGLGAVALVVRRRMKAETASDMLA